MELRVVRSERDGALRRTFGLVELAGLARGDREIVPIFGHAGFQLHQAAQHGGGLGVTLQGMQGEPVREQDDFTCGLRRRGQRLRERDDLRHVARLEGRCDAAGDLFGHRQ